MVDQVVTIEAVNPESVACDPALLACALETVGVEPHPRFHFRDITETIAGTPRRVWRWHYQVRSSDARYETAQLIKWWNSDSWSAANPLHEFAILKAGLRNFCEIARRIRQEVPRVRVTRGNLFAEIPTTATPERRQWLMDQVDGRIPFGTPFKPADTAPAHGS